MKRTQLWLVRAALAGTLALTSVPALWGLMQNPFAAPLVERTAEGAARALEAQFRRAFTPDWLADALDSALAADDTARALWLAGLARDEGLALHPDQAAAVAALEAATSGWIAGAAACGACALDPAACDSLAQLGVCLVPFEMSPLGDANALRRNGMAALTGAEPDMLETGLALVGIGATVTVVLSGGTSVVVKAGAGTLRVARRMGSLTPGFSRALGDAADLPVNWGAALRGAPLEDVTDAARLSRLGGMAGDVGTILRQTSVPDTLLLLRHVDSAEDAARMARLTTIAGPRSLARVEVLGKARAFRALVRLSDVAVATLLALYALGMQLVLLLAGAVGQRVTRRLRPRLDKPARLQA